MAENQSAGGIWPKTIKKKDGTTVEVLSISIDGKRYTAWPNDKATAENKQPKYRIQADNYEPKKEATGIGQDDKNLPF
jgi:hypothetical protein